MVQSLVFLTYYQEGSLDSDQKQRLNELLVKELSRTRGLDCESMDYFMKIIDLLTNMTADEDHNLNLYLIDSNILHVVVAKINDLSNEAGRALHQYGDR